MTFLLPIVLMFAPQAPAAGSVPDVVKGITGRDLGAHMQFLASDAMKGRDTGSPEILIASEYLASRLAMFGAEPIGDEVEGARTYFAKFPIVSTTPKAAGTELVLKVERNEKKEEFVGKLGGDFYVFPRNLAAGDIEAPVVFVGQGVVDADQNRDDFDGVDVKDKFVLITGGGAPAGRAGQATMRALQAANRATAEAFKRGAVGVLMIQAAGAESSPNISPAMVSRTFGQPTVSLGGGEPTPPSITVGNSLRDSLFKAIDKPEGPEKPGALEGVRAKFAYAGSREAKDERNVIGWFPGSDPEKKKEVVIYSAHYDHVGMQGGQIHNGSDDNGSGTSSILEIAQAFGEGPRPARTVAFLWVSGEEKGLWGSAYFADHPTLPEGYKIVADINLDMVSRNAPNEVGITPSPKHDDYSTLIPAAQAAGKVEGMNLLYSLRYEAQNRDVPVDSFYGRTDSFNFAKKGIPVIFFFSGEHEDYHRPTDDFAKADTEKAARIARTAYRLGWQTAQAPEAPHKIDPPADEPKKDVDAGK